MFSYAEDKNKLAMMAIPVVLSLFFGFSSSAKSAYLPQSMSVEKIYVAKTGSVRENRFLSSSSKKQALQSAIENSDYEAFKIATKDTPFSDIMTPEAFELLVDQYQMYKKV